MKPKHTPGPWGVAGQRSNKRWAVVRNDSWSDLPLMDGWTIADVYSRKMNADEDEANARLIAAAPEMLDALKWLIEFCGLNQYDKNDPAIAKVWAALAKAEGRDE